MPYEPKTFRCTHCGWALGESYREDGRHITQLRIYRHASVLAQMVPEQPAILFAAVQVNDATVICDHCGAMTSWYANQTAIAEMLERRSSQPIAKTNSLVVQSV